jgi:predicted metal-binding membrane protein
VTGAVPQRVELRRMPAVGHLVQERHPEWWLWAVAGAGVLVMGTQVVLGWLAGPGTAAVPGHAGHHAAATGTGSAVVVVVAHAVGWAAMVAVMTPLVAVNVRFVAMRSPRRARTGVTGDVVAGWAVAWAGAVILLGLGAWLVTSAVGELGAIGLLTGVAIAWQCSALKRRSVARCHRILAPPLDRKQSRRRCRRYGVGLGRDCVLSCWPLMGLMAVAGHNPLVVASSVGVAWYERRRRPHHDPATTQTSLAIAATGAAALVVAYVT